MLVHAHLRLFRQALHRQTSFVNHQVQPRHKPSTAEVPVATASTAASSKKSF